MSSRDLKNLTVGEIIEKLKSYGMQDSWPTNVGSVQYGFPVLFQGDGFHITVTEQVCHMQAKAVAERKVADEMERREQLLRDEIADLQRIAAEAIGEQTRIRRQFVRVLKKRSVSRASIIRAAMRPNSKVWKSK